VAAAQAKLLAVVEGISEELARLKAEVQLQVTALAGGASTSAVANEQALMHVSSLRDDIDELKRGLVKCEHQQGQNTDAFNTALSRHDRALQVQAGEQREALAAETRRINEEVQSLRRQQLDVRELIAEDRRQTVENIERDLAPLLAHADVVAHIESRFAAAERTLGDLEGHVEARLEALQREFAQAVAACSEFRLVEQVEAKIEARLKGLRLEDQLTGLRADLEERIFGQLKIQLDACRLECQEGARGQLEDLRLRLSEHVHAAQALLVKELRAETLAALNREAASIAALDEQLWITDQRLGQRIDELAHLHLRERVALAERQQSQSQAAASQLPRRIVSSKADFSQEDIPRAALCPEKEPKEKYAGDFAGTRFGKSSATSSNRESAARAQKHGGLGIAAAAGQELMARAHREDDSGAEKNSPDSASESRYSRGAPRPRRAASQGGSGGGLGLLLEPPPRSRGREATAAEGPLGPRSPAVAAAAARAEPSTLPRGASQLARSQEQLAAELREVQEGSARLGGAQYSLRSHVSRSMLSGSSDTTGNSPDDVGFRR